MKGSRCARFAAVGFALGLAACSVNVQSEKPPDTRPERLATMTLDCIFVDTIDDWKVLDNYNLIIYAPTRQTAYLIEIDTYCSALRSAERITLSPHALGRLCSSGGDALIAGGQRCLIGAIRPYKAGGDFDRGGPKPERR